MTNWSSQQAAIFDWFTSGQGNLVVRARAGTGKTTTILEALSRASCKSAVLCAFNKRIAEELNARLTQPQSGKAEAKTLHAIGFAFVRASERGVKVESNRGRLLAEAACPRGTDREVIALVAKLAGLAKGVLLPGATEGELENLAYAYGIESDDVSTDKLARWASAALLAAVKCDGTCDFDDMVYLPLARRCIRASYDLVVVDEAQDMSPAQIELARHICRKGGRIAVVGDDRQAIYGFRGADSGSIDRLKRELSAAELPLTVTYRCGKAIVAEAAKIVPDFVAAETNGAGELAGCSREECLEASRSGDFILSRTNAPLASVCLALLRAGRPARIQGRDIGAGLSALVKKIAGRVVGIDGFLPRLAEWQSKEMRRLAALDAAGKDVKALEQYVADQADTLTELAAGLSTVAELQARIGTLFADAGAGVVCSTVHKAKGLEADSVYVLSDTFKFNGPEEDNVRYVAITRAKRRLAWVA